MSLRVPRGRHASVAWFACALLLLTPRLSAQEPGAPPAVLQGTVYDSVSGRPLRIAVVQAAGGAVSTLTNDEGRYSIQVPQGVVRLQVRQIGYHPVTLTVTVGAGLHLQDVFLVPLPVELAPLTVTATIDPAREIVARAIERKNDFMSRIHDYRYNAYVKFVVRDLSKPRNSAAGIALISETRTTAYWERPDHYQETILARRQSSNLDPDRNLVSVREIVNFNRNRIDLRRYSLVSPIADDALEYYDYHMLDTLVTASGRVFRLAVEPRSESTPLFAGTLDIADSTYDVRRIDLGVNTATRFNLVQDVRYQQQMEDLGDGRWIPSQIRLSGQVHLGLPVPGIPRHLAFEQVAVLDSFRFDEGHPPPNLGEYRVVVDPMADQADTAVWNAPGAIPLSADEHAAWVRIDSAAAAPQDFGRRLGQGGLFTRRLLLDPDFFHYNRADGAYLGASQSWWPDAGARLSAKLGYATGSERWQYDVEGRLGGSPRAWAGVSWHDETMPRSTWISRGYNPTVRALLFGIDPLDYYRERGLTLSAGTTLLDFTDLDLRYDDARQWSLPVVTEYSVFRRKQTSIANPPITDGHLRSVKAGLTYDSRSRIRRTHDEQILPSLSYTRVRLEGEFASPSLIPNDFDFRWYTLTLERRQRTFNFGVTTLTASGGIATGTVPPQRYFTIDFGMRTLTFQGNGFNTLPEVNFAGTRALMLVLRHDFDRLLFAKSGLPLIRRLPFTLSVQGGVFWTDFAGHVPIPADTFFATAPKVYRELGFGLGNLTPFLRPLNLAAHFTWQLSRYATRGFQFSFGLTRP